MVGLLGAGLFLGEHLKLEGGGVGRGLGVAAHAIAVARRVPAGPETDALVASQLWLENRQFPWWRHQKVAGNVLANIQSAIAREGG